MDAPVTAADGNAGFVSTLPSLPTGTHVISANVQVTEGENRIPENDLLSVVTTVRGKPNVLMIEGMPGEAKPVQDALTASGVNVTVKSPKEIPSRLSVLSDIDAIAMVDVNAKDLTLDQMTTIQQSVRANGRGLIVHRRQQLLRLRRVLRYAAGRCAAGQDGLRARQPARSGLARHHHRPLRQHGFRRGEQGPEDRPGPHGGESRH